MRLWIDNLATNLSENASEMHLLQIITGRAIWHKYLREGFANITYNVRAWPIHFVIPVFCDINVGDLSFFSFFSEQSLFRIQTRHFWSFLLRLVVALTKSAPAFLLIENT